MRKVLGSDFFERRPQIVARKLLGKFLVRRINEQYRMSFMITEVEAYDGEKDLACHASKGRTKRTEIMFGHAGYWYVYFVYGMHDMLNIVTGPKDYPSAVLIRGVCQINKKTRKGQTFVGKNNKEIYKGLTLVSLDGPGKLTRELRITRALNGKKASRASGLWIEDREMKVRRSSIKTTPRIGVAYAGEWVKKPWRFVLKR